MLGILKMTVSMDMELQPIQTEQSIQGNLRQVNDTVLVLLLFQMAAHTKAFLKMGILNKMSSILVFSYNLKL